MVMSFDDPTDECMLNLISLTMPAVRPGLRRPEPSLFRGRRTVAAD
jgi:hypothetical protein